HRQAGHRLSSRHTGEQIGARMSTFSRRAIAGVVALATVTATAACGDGGSSGSGGDGQGGYSSASVAAAKARGTGLAGPIQIGYGPGPLPKGAAGKTIAVVSNQTATGRHSSELYAAAAQKLGLKVKTFAVGKSAEEVANAFDQIVADRSVEGLIVGSMDPGAW